MGEAFEAKAVGLGEHGKRRICRRGRCADDAGLNQGGEAEAFEARCACLIFVLCPGNKFCASRGLQHRMRNAERRGQRPDFILIPTPGRSAVG